MQYARISLIVAVDDESDSPLSEVLHGIDQNKRVVVLEFRDEDMYLLDQADAAKLLGGTSHEIVIDSDG